MERVCHMPCRYWGWDPDGAYCVNKEVIELRKQEKDPDDPPLKDYPHGLAIERANLFCNPGNGLPYFEPHPKGPDRKG
jgi:hypothetical protein